ncbi:hypothetical protein GUJ93_ZPchr0001g30724 [Zizania palustris]|uniref:Uncharacterized protein n=1 Tax=Zizania palustris TaxID=103762 RepID=A0A8J5RCM6_ZIZPA|nr:hypothetical protein GUJ93_ZPchr0001g30724 [Zizania palustris]
MAQRPPPRPYSLRRRSSALRPAPARSIDGPPPSPLPLLASPMTRRPAPACSDALRPAPARSADGPTPCPCLLRCPHQSSLLYNNAIVLAPNSSSCLIPRCSKELDSDRNVYIRPSSANDPINAMIIRLLATMNDLYSKAIFTLSNSALRYSTMMIGCQI